MKNKLLLMFAMSVLTMSLLTGCGGEAANTANNAETATEAPTTTPEPTPESVDEEVEEVHEHTYTETITTEATCETDGEATYTCECGDSYTETIATQGHVFETYTSNNDATFTADGTETAKCNNCDVTDTRTAEGSMLTYTYTDMDATMYAQKTVNVRSLPNTDGEKLGSLSTNDEVKVTGQCAETSWYRIEYSGGVAYVSNSYLGNDKVVVEQPKAPEQTAQSASTSEAFPYELNKVYNNGTVAWVFYCDAVESDNWSASFNECSAFNRSHFDIFSDDGTAALKEACVATGLADASVTPGFRHHTKWYINGVVVDVLFAL